jgi:RHS repeat-associated protein
MKYLLCLALAFVIAIVACLPGHAATRLLKDPSDPNHRIPPGYWEETIYDFTLPNGGSPVIYFHHNHIAEASNALHPDGSVRFWYVYTASYYTNYRTFGQWSISGYGAYYPSGPTVFYDWAEIENGAVGPEHQRALQRYAPNGDLAMRLRDGLPPDPDTPFSGDATVLPDWLTTCPDQTCPPPDLSSVDTATETGGSGGNVEDGTSYASIIDNHSLRHIHYADDYRVVPPSGCTSCAAQSDNVGELPSLRLTRYHRYRDLDRPSSFGPGVYLNYDVSFTADIDAGKTLVSLWDPRNRNAIELNDAGGAGDFQDNVRGVIAGFAFYDAAGTRTTNYQSALTARATTHGGVVYTFDVIRAGAAASSERCGRLTRIANRNGQAITLSYAYAANATDAALLYDRTRLWRLSSITDAHGEFAAVTYGVATIAGRWAISTITLPTGGSVTYSYNAKKLVSLSGITHANGDVSTFTVGSNASAQATTIAYDDAAAAPTHRRKTASYSRMAWMDGKSGAFISSPIGCVREVANNVGESIYKSRGANLGTSFRTTIQSQGITHALTTSKSTGAPLAAIAWQPGLTVDRTLETYTSVDAKKRILGVSDALGRLTSFTRDPRHGAITQRTFPDLSKESATYNQFRQALTQTDRLSNLTAYTYDAVGNILTKTVAKGTVDQAVWQWRYNEAGSNARPGQPSSLADANGNVTRFVYDANGYLVTIIEPLDGPEVTVNPKRAFAYDAAGRLISSTDAELRSVTYAYDANSRLISTAYANSTSDRIGYGSTANGTANLMVWTSDRNNAHTVNQYDATGRLTATYSGLVLIAGKTSSGNLADYANVGDAAYTQTTYKASTTLPTKVIANGGTTTYAYDNDLREISRVTTTGQSRAITDSVVYDAADRVDTRSRTVFGAQFDTLFVYDSLDRVTRTITEAIPGGVSTLSGAQRVALVRPTIVNAGYVIADDSYDAGIAYGPSTLVTGRIADVRIHSDGLGTKTVRAFDHQGRLAESVAAHGAAIQQRTVFTHDPQGNVTRIHHPRHFTETGGFITATTYSGRNLERDRTHAFGRTEAVTTRKLWTPARNIGSVTAAFGTAAATTTSYTYSNCCPRIKSIIDPDGFMRSFTYDGIGRPITLTDPLGHITAAQYDARGRLVKQTNALNQATTYAYDDNLSDAVGLSGTYASALTGLTFAAGSDGSAVASTDALGKTSLVIMDNVGRTIRAVDANGNKTTTTYDKAVADASTGTGSLLVMTDVADALGNITSARVDGIGRTIAVKDADLKYTKFTYNALGNRLSERDPNTVGRNNTYDALGRLASSVDTFGAATSQSYDAANNQIAAVDGEGKSWNTQYDGLDRPTRSTDRIGAATTFAYDARGNRTAITDAQAGVTTYAFDKRDQMITEIFPGTTGGTRRYAYDADGRLQSRVDQTGATTTYGYDNADRLTGRLYADGLNDAFTYDNVGRMLTARSNRYDNTVTRAYDPAGRLTQETQAIGGVNHIIGYAYDADNRPVTTTYPGGNSVARTYTKRHQLATVALDGASVINRVYDVGMRLTTTTLGNGLVEARTYRTDNLVQSISAPNVVNLSYAYNKAHSKTGETDAIIAANSQTFGYDAQQRLISWGSGGATQSWALSPVGDMNSVTTNGVTQTRAHSPVHEITTVDTTALAYDAKGNLTRNLNGALYGWDSENRMNSATIADADVGVTDTATYAYDALGRRVQKTTYGVTTTFLHDGAQVIREFDAPQQLPPAAANDDGLASAKTVAPPGGGILTSPLVRVNFQPSLRAIPPGFVADKGKIFGARGNGSSYGWLTTAQTNTVARVQHPFPQYDTFNKFWKDAATPTGVWEFTLPNGTYPVVIVLGDCTSQAQTNNINVESVKFTDPDPSVTTPVGYDRGDFDGYLANIVVADGKLTIKAQSTALNPKLCWLEIGAAVAAGSTVPAATKTKLDNAIADATARTSEPVFPKAQVGPRVFVYGSYVDEPLMLQTGAGVVANRYYFHSNHLHSVAALTNSSGSVVERYKYDAHGRRTVLTATGVVLGAESSFGNNVGFTGRYLDQETGLWYFRARMFDSALGRFIGRDPLGFVDGMSLYGAYFAPNGTDPSGLITEAEKNCIDANLKTLRADLRLAYAKYQVGLGEAQYVYAEELKAKVYKDSYVTAVSTLATIPIGGAAAMVGTRMLTGATILARSAALGRAIMLEGAGIIDLQAVNMAKAALVSARSAAGIMSTITETTMIAGGSIAMAKAYGEDFDATGATLDLSNVNFSELASGILDAAQLAASASKILAEASARQGGVDLDDIGGSLALLRVTSEKAVERFKQALEKCKDPCNGK